MDDDTPFCAWSSTQLYIQLLYKYSSFSKKKFTYILFYENIKSKTRRTVWKFYTKIFISGRHFQLIGSDWNECLMGFLDGQWKGYSLLGIRDDFMTFDGLWLLLLPLHASFNVFQCKLKSMSSII